MPTYLGQNKPSSGGAGVSDDIITAIMNGDNATLQAAKDYAIPLTDKATQAQYNAGEAGKIPDSFMVKADFELKADKADLVSGTQEVSIRCFGASMSYQALAVAANAVKHIQQFRLENGNVRVTLPEIVAHDATITNLQINEGVTLEFINQSISRHLHLIGSSSQEIFDGVSRSNVKTGEVQSITHLTSSRDESGQFYWHMKPWSKLYGRLAHFEDLEPITANIAVIEADIAGLETNKADTNHDHADLISTTEKGASNGVASLDTSGKIPQSQLPAIAISSVDAVTSKTEMLALDVAKGAVAIRSDVSKTFILANTPASDVNNWLEMLTPTDIVTSVNGQVGVIVLSAIDVGAIAVTDIATLQQIIDGTASKILDASGFKLWCEQYDFSKLDYTLTQDRTIKITGSNQYFGYDNRVFNADFLAQNWVCDGIIASVSLDELINENVWYKPDTTSGNKSDYYFLLPFEWWQKARTEGGKLRWNVRSTGGRENFWFGFSAATNTSLTAEGLGFDGIVGQAGFRVTLGNDNTGYYINILSGSDTGVKRFTATDYINVEFVLDVGASFVEIFANGERLGQSDIEALSHSYFNDRVTIGSGSSASTDERIWIRAIDIIPSMLVNNNILTKEMFDKNQIINITGTDDYDFILPSFSCAYGSTVEINCLNTGFINIKDNAGTLVKSVNSGGDTSIKITQISLDADGNAIAGTDFKINASNEAPAVFVPEIKEIKAKKLAIRDIKPIENIIAPVDRVFDIYRGFESELEQVLCIEADTIEEAESQALHYIINSLKQKLKNSDVATDFIAYTDNKEVRFFDAIVNSEFIKAYGDIDKACENFKQKYELNSNGCINGVGFCN